MTLSTWTIQRFASGNCISASELLADPDEAVRDLRGLSIKHLGPGIRNAIDVLKVHLKRVKT